MVVDTFDEIAKELGRTPSQIAINWVLQRPTVSSVIIGARNEAQLRQKIGAVGRTSSDDHVARPDAASETRPSYPYWHQRLNLRLDPPPMPDRTTEGKIAGPSA